MYGKTDWTEKVAVTAERLNKIEKGIEDAHKIAEGITNLAGKANGFAILDSNGKIKNENLEPAKEEMVKEFTFTKLNDCKMIYSASKIQVKNGLAVVLLDMTFAKNVTKNYQINLASTTATKMAPAVDIGINSVTNAGKRCNVIVKNTGVIAVTAIDDLEKGDGIRAQTVYFI